MVFSADATAQAVSQVESAGAYAFLTKPIVAAHVDAERDIAFAERTIESFPRPASEADRPARSGEVISRQVLGTPPTSAPATPFIGLFMEGNACATWAKCIDAIEESCAQSSWETSGDQRSHAPGRRGRQHGSDAARRHGLAHDAASRLAARLGLARTGPACGS